MYYPALVKRMLQKRDTPRTQEDWQSLFETVDFYRRVFNILCTRAHRQMEYALLRPVSLTSSWIGQEVQRVCKSCNRKHKVDVRLQVELPEQEMSCLGDNSCVAYLLRLCVETIHAQCREQLTLRVSRYADTVKIAIGTPEGSWQQEELDKLFYPAEEHIPYLIMRQIVRMHDDYFDFRGCRIVAEARDAGGYDIWFTLVEDKYAKV
jgi:hypothetical protein